MQGKIWIIHKNNNNKICKKFRGAHPLNKTQTFYHDIYQLIILRISSAIYRLCLCACGLYILLFRSIPVPAQGTSLTCTSDHPHLDHESTLCTAFSGGHLTRASVPGENVSCDVKHGTLVTGRSRVFQIPVIFKDIPWQGSARTKHCKRLKKYMF